MEVDYHGYFASSTMNGWKVIVKIKFTGNGAKSESLFEIQL